MRHANTILVVDDDNDLRHLFSVCLRRAGYQVLEASTGRDGLQLAQARLPNLVLLDVRLPDIDGGSICRQIKNDPALKDVFVALCSGEATSDANKVDGFQTGADEYIVKPFGVEELLARVNVLMRLRNTAAALRASEEHHRRLIDILPDAVCLIHPHGRMLAANSQAVTMLGYTSAEELLNATIYQITPAEEHERIKADFAAAMRTGVIRNFEYSMLRKDGTVFKVELSATTSLGVDIEPAGCLISVIRDITERKKVQEALQASEERFRQMAGHIQQVFWMSNVDKGEIIYVSPAYEEIWGRPCASLYSSPFSWLDSVHPEDREIVASRAQSQQVTGEYNEVYRVIRPDGSLRWVQDRAFPIRDAAGNIYRIVGVADDITHRKQAWDALRAGEARKRAIMEAALDAIVTIDHEGQMVELNPAAAKVFAHSRAKLVGQSFLEVIPDSLRPWFQQGLTRCFTGDKGPSLGSRIEVPALRADGSRFFAEFTITRIRLEGQPMFTIYCRDITQRKRADSELRSLSQRIISAQEAERSRIAQELHDGVNQLVASVKMRLHKVQENLPDLKPAAAEILSRCDRLLVKILEENRRIAHNLRPMDLDQLGLAAACSSFTADVQSRSNLLFECHVSAQVQQLRGETGLHLFRIVQEAINNIEKHARAKNVILHIRFQGGSVILKIQDDGRGFDLKTLKTGVKRRHGLGLTNMRERALSMGGTCEITSVPGRGTMIVVRVPLKTAVNHVPAKTPAPAPAPESA
jgi:PAS domain S-box-containing protein